MHPEHPCLHCGFFAWQWVGVPDCPYGFYCSACAQPAPGMPESVGKVVLWMLGLKDTTETMAI